MIEFDVRLLHLVLVDSKADFLLLTPARRCAPRPPKRGTPHDVHLMLTHYGIILGVIWSSPPRGRWHEVPDGVNNNTPIPADSPPQSHAPITTHSSSKMAYYRRSLYRLKREKDGET